MMIVFTTATHKTRHQSVEMRFHRAKRPCLSCMARPCTYLFSEGGLSVIYLAQCQMMPRELATGAEGVYWGRVLDASHQSAFACVWEYDLRRAMGRTSTIAATHETIRAMK